MKLVHQIALEPDPERTLALVVHDGKKDEMLRLARAHRAILPRFRLIATASTGRLLGEQLGIHVETVASGPKGGDLQIGARIVDGTIDAVVFLRDPLNAHPRDPDIQTLLKVCDIHLVPGATNVASAEILLRHLARPALRAEVRRTSHPSVFSSGYFPWDPAGRRMLR